jgi:hypothetical protein
MYYNYIHRVAANTPERKGVIALTTDKVLTIVIAALTFEAVFIATIVAIVVAITKMK